MKNDLATAIGVAVLGAVIAYFVTNLFIGPIEAVEYKTVDTKTSSDLVDPNVEVFNYRALNPTVEVYVGDCDEYDANGECIDNKVQDSSQETP